MIYGGENADSLPVIAKKNRAERRDTQRKEETSITVCKIFGRKKIKDKTFENRYKKARQKYFALSYHSCYLYELHDSI